jgi:serpin B
MVVLLPKNADGIADLEKHLTADQLVGWMKKLSKREVQVSLPKFKTTGRFQLADTLISLGMRAAFNDADFTGMDGERGLRISKVIHQSYVDVNEEGTEAAAATAVVVGFGTAAIHPPPPVFRADHPFLYLIRDQKTGSILFFGRMVEVSK